MNEKCYDVIVAGGGPAGTAAAISAARQGLKTLVIEHSGCFGGISTSGVLPFWLGVMNGSIPFPKMVEQGLVYKNLPRPQRVVGGIFQEAIDRITAADGGVGPAVMAQTDRCPGLDRLGCHDEFTFDLEIGKRVLDEMVVDSGADILFHSMIVGTEFSQRKIAGVYVANKEGITYITADRFVDCTGDADLIARSGLATDKGDRKTGELTASSLVIHIEDIDSPALENYLNEGGDPWFRGCCQSAKENKPDADIPKALIIFPMIQKGVFMVNGGTGMNGIDGTNADDVTRIMLKGRQRAKTLVEDLFRPYVPGAENCRLRLTATYPGIRETRRIIAEYTLQEEDLLEGKRFDDTIALAGRHFDLGRGKQEQPFQKRDLSVKGGITPIPYRCLVPREADNVIVAGRCIAAEGQSLGPARIMSTCFAMGEAAGIAAFLSLRKAIPYRDVDCGKLQDILREQGAILDCKS